MNQLQERSDNVTHHIHQDLYAKQVHIAAGESFMQHTHRFDHMSILAQGEVDVSVSGVIERHVAPSVILIKGGIPHSVTAITDSVWFCIHATAVLERPTEIK